MEAAPWLSYRGTVARCTPFGIRACLFRTATTDSVICRRFRYRLAARGRQQKKSVVPPVGCLVAFALALRCCQRTTAYYAKKMKNAFSLSTNITWKFDSLHQQAPSDSEERLCECEQSSYMIVVGNAPVSNAIVTIVALIMKGRFRKREKFI